ncbi:uncharacterized protein LOC125727551 [Brienomyrus brachyistius]|uniref:uncharacterized protein LOC125727551 n=1 Tax=Brienomyrus brachyistius TaxID=42636 RepID=UPI0020B3A29E|nr:uncharacterized protein LOC125727551 [Brienomyrus brachyistius]
MCDKVKEPTDDVWQLTLQLKDIVELICAQKISLPEVAYLDVLIQEYLACRFSLFPGHRLKPKHHYLRHYPALILKFGPLIRLWTMRFEKMGDSELNTSNISNAIDAVLPELPIATKKSLEDTLKSLGVESSEDFRFLQESDLTAVLKPIQARKFMSVLKETRPSCYAADRFMLSVDRKIVNDDITTFIAAVSLMFGSYYCFNIHYPTELASVLEFLQRCLFIINPEKGTKVVEKKNKKRLPVNPRVFTLISDLSDYEWRETL